MKLHFKPGACSLGAHIVLRELDEPFELDRTDTEGGTTESGADYASINPNGYVPALQFDSGDILTENVAILAFLSDLRPESALAVGAEPLIRARHNELLSFLSSELHKAFSPFFTGAAETPAAREAALDRLSRRIGAVERQLADGRAFLLGQQFRPADAYAFAILNWTGVIGLDLAPWPRTAAYVERLRARPSVRQAMAAEGLVSEAAA